MLWYVLIAAGLLVLDQAVKWWALHILQPMGTLPLIENIVHLTYVENRGAAFSFLAEYNARWLLALLAFAVTGVIFWMLYQKKVQTALGRGALTAIAAGAIGNALDRVFYGFVVDLFDFRGIHFAVFNVADIYICVGAALFAYYVLVQHKDMPNNHQDRTCETSGERDA